MARLSVFGSGYVGLVAGVCFAEHNNHVICVDVDLERVEMLKRGECPIFEPGLTELLKKVIARGNIEFTADAEYAIKKSDIHFICVGTPTNQIDDSADLSYVFEVAKTIGKYMQEYSIIVDKSTVPVGTGQKVNDIILEQLNLRGVSVQFDVVSNPEFLREGSSVKDFIYPDRVVIGCADEKAALVMKHLYEPMTRNGNPIIVTKKLESAELIKYGANAFLANKISFVNELANLCEAVGADIREVTRGMGTDSRISPQFIYPGPGYGGSCFPKDTKALSITGKKYGVDMNHVNITINSNEAQKLWCAKKIGVHYNGNLNGKVIGVWGLAFKANTDDMRDSSAIVVIKYLLENGAIVKVYDPEAMKNARNIFGDSVQYCSSRECVLENSDALVVLTEWLDFRMPDYLTLRKFVLGLRDKVIFDFRNLYAMYKDDLRSDEIQWYGVGIVQ